MNEEERKDIQRSSDDTSSLDSATSIPEGFDELIDDASDASDTSNAVVSKATEAVTQTDDSVVESAKDTIAEAASDIKSELESDKTDISDDISDVSNDSSDIHECDDIPDMTDTINDTVADAYKSQEQTVSANAVNDDTLSKAEDEKQAQTTPLSSSSSDSSNDDNSTNTASFEDYKNEVYTNSDVDDLDYPKSKKKSKKFLGWLIPAIIGGAAAAVILGGGAVNKDKFWNDTWFNDTYVGGKTLDEVRASLDADDKQIALVTREGNTETVNLKDIDYKSDFNTDISEIKNSQSPFLWFMHMGGKNTYDVDIETSYDEKALDDKLNNLDCITNDSIQDPVDAHLALADNTFTIVEATEGNRIDSKKLSQTVKDAISAGTQEINLDEAGAYETPAIYANDSKLTATLDKLTDINNTVVKLNLHDAEETIDKNTFSSWLNTNGTDITLDSDKLAEYLDGVADKYDTFQTERKFQATGIGEITVGAGDFDTYGFQLDKESTAADIESAILSATSDTIDAYWTTPANTRNAANGDIGDTYVEIDISRQHMWYYVDGELYIDTDVRTGTESSAQWTPTTEGVFRILWLQTDKWFLQVGPPVHSDYWMPFNHRGEGIHDATWYSSFGSNYYKWAGSHGCINTPYSVVQTMFQRMDVGTPVIVYRS